MRDELKVPSHSASKTPPAAAYSNGPVPVQVETTISEIQELMWKQAGIVRTGTGLKQALQQLEQIGSQLKPPRSRREYEARNLHITGTLVAQSALAREESRGAQYRTDFPDHNDAKFKKHSVLTGSQISFE
jgi:L-aspartate oxidase